MLKIAVDYWNCKIKRIVSMKALHWKKGFFFLSPRLFDYTFDNAVATVLLVFI